MTKQNSIVGSSRTWRYTIVEAEATIETLQRWMDPCVAGDPTFFFRADTTIDQFSQPTHLHKTLVHITAASVTGAWEIHRSCSLGHTCTEYIVQYISRSTENLSYHSWPIAGLCVTLGIQFPGTWACSDSHPGTTIAMSTFPCLHRLLRMTMRDNLISGQGNDKASPIPFPHPISPSVRACLPFSLGDLFVLGPR